MSHFYGSMQGNRGAATRQGSKNSGIEAHVRGWNVGVSVDCQHDTIDRCRVYATGMYATGGSNIRCPLRCIAEVREVTKEEREKGYSIVIIFDPEKPEGKTTILL